MTRRITVPEGQIGLIISAQLADDIMSLCRQIRRHNWRGYELVEITNSSDIERDTRVSDAHMNEHNRYKIAGNLMLALLEAKEG